MGFNSAFKGLMFTKMLVIFRRFSCLPFQPRSSNRWVVCNSHFQNIYVQPLVITFENSEVEIKPAVKEL